MPNASGKLSWLSLVGKMGPGCSGFQSDCRGRSVLGSRATVALVCPLTYEGHAGHRLPGRKLKENDWRRGKKWGGGQWSRKS